ncbi:MAG: tRNA glutamyl-Q(34) synthetase GluQRS [Treponema sp.]|nr:tRNA glutamyl-Q(34) synthetase GluQRS [Treponema sp.]
MTKGRFAPSPSGRMHLGNIYAALISWLSAKKDGGQWLLRIEDLDKQRCKREWADRLMDDLLWLGLEWDEGPGKKYLQDQKAANEAPAKIDGGAARDLQDQKAAKPAGFTDQNRAAAKSYYQSERDSIYQKYFRALEERGLVYDCFCRRADLLAASAPHASDGTPIYAGTCRKLSAADRERLLKERSPAKRMRLPDRESIFVDGHYGPQKCKLASDAGDFIIRRADGNFSYQLAVTVDDALMGVTQVARGRDLLASTHQQLFLYEALGLAAPQFLHFPLLVDKEGRRLSKRDKDLDMGYLRTRFSPQEIIGKLMFLCGMSPSCKPMDLQEAAAIFVWNKLPREDIVVGK